MGRARMGGGVSYTAAHCIRRCGSATRRGARPHTAARVRPTRAHTVVQVLWALVGWGALTGAVRTWVFELSGSWGLCVLWCCVAVLPVVLTACSLGADCPF